MLFLPRVFPGQVAEVPDEWRWLVGGLGLFSGALLFFWFLGAVGKTITKAPKTLRSMLPDKPLTDLEMAFLAIMGSREPNGSLDLDALDHSKISKLEMFQMCKELQNRNLVQLNPFHKELVSLTDKGRKTALMIIQQDKA